jgi:hypothetical protein
MVIYVGMYCLTRPLSIALENRAGFLMDTWFAYMAVRLVLTDRASVASFVKTTALVLAPLALFGVVEAVAHWQPFLLLKRFRPWSTIAIGERDDIEIGAEGRWGFSRATGPFSHSIMFGLCFVMFLPMIWALRRERGQWSKLAYPFSAVTLIGAVSSMSSGPWVASGATIFFLMVERYKRWVKQGLIALAVATILAGTVSNRPFYHVIVDYANPLGGSGWQRARIIDCAIEDFDEWWLAGYGGQDPGWGPRTGMGHTDLNNEFLMAGVEYGIWGMAALIAVYASAMKVVIRAHKPPTDPQLQSWAWSIGASIIATAIAGMGVSFFGAPTMLFYLIIGLAGSLNSLQREVLVSQKVSCLHVKRRPDCEIFQGAST